VDQLKRGGGVAGSLFGMAASLSVAAEDGALPQGFNVGEKVFAGLLAQHFAEQHAE
jgi:hypothetical protein